MPGKRRMPQTETGWNACRCDEWVERMDGRWIHREVTGQSCPAKSTQQDTRMDEVCTIHDLALDEKRRWSWNYRIFVLVEALRGRSVDDAGGGRRGLGVPGHPRTLPMDDLLAR